MPQVSRWQKGSAAALLLLLCLVLWATARWCFMGGHLVLLHKPSEAIAGAYHVHSDRSHDSTVSAAAWAHAAKGLGLDFIVLTDHNVLPRAPEMLDGVLVLFEREASMPWGHRVEWQDGRIAAHPFDNKRPYIIDRARPTDVEALEIASASSNARALGGLTLLRLLPALALGAIWPEAALGQLYRRDDRALALWDEPWGAHKAGLCALDAHGWLPREDELALWRMVLPEIVPVRPLQLHQAQQVRDALARGRALCVSGLLPAAAGAAVAPDMTESKQHADGWASDAGSPSHSVSMAARACGLDALAARGVLRLQLFCNGDMVCETAGTTCRAVVPPVGSCRAEVLVEVPQPLAGSVLMPLVYSPRVQVAAP